MVVQSSLLRSPAFWLGVPGLIFLVWIWRDSVNMDRMWSRDTRIGSFRLNHADSGFSLTRAPVGSPHGFIDDLWRFSRRETHTKEGSFRNEVFVRWPRPEYDRDYLGRPFVLVPYWGIIAFYLLLWSALLAWRRRRFHKSMRAMV